MSSKANVLIKGSILRTAEFIANAIIGLLLMPFIIHSLGDKMYGMWIFVGSFLGYYGLMDFGLSSAVQRFVSRAIPLNDHDEENKIINTSFILFSIIGVLVLIASVVIAFALPIFISNISDVKIFRIVILILGFDMAIGFPLRVFSGILTAHIRYDVSTTIDLAKLVIRTLLVIYFLKHGYGILSLALITFALDVGSYASRYLVVKNFYKYVVLSLKYVDTSKIKSLFGYSFYTFIGQIANQLRFNVDNLVITAMLGLNYVTPYSIGSRLISYFIEFVGAATGMLTPVFSQYESSKRNELMIERFLFLTKITGYFTCLIGGLLILLGKPFIERWVGVGYSVSYTVLLILAIPTIIALMQNASVQLLFGVSKHKIPVIASLIESIINLVLSILLAPKYGLIGVAMGTAIPMTLEKIVFQPIYTCMLIGISIKKFLFKSLMPILLNSTIIFGFAWLLIQSHVKAEYIQICFYGTIVSIIFIAYIFVIGFSKSEKKYIYQILSAIWSKLLSSNMNQSIHRL